MFCVYTTNSTAVSKEKTIPQLLEKLPYSMHKRALRYRREEDSYNFIMGRLLLKEGLKDFRAIDTIEDIFFEENGKPSLNSVFFNIAHTSDLVVCAISENGRIGIDIEKEKAVELEHFDSWFTSVEWKSINEAKVSLHQFYRYWTRKESIIKALGLKLSYLNQIELDIEQDVFSQDGKQWYLKELNLGADHVGAICSEIQLDFPVTIKTIAF